MRWSLALLLRSLLQEQKKKKHDISLVLHYKCGNHLNRLSMYILIQIRFSINDSYSKTNCKWYSLMTFLFVCLFVNFLNMHSASEHIQQHRIYYLGCIIIVVQIEQHAFVILKLSRTRMWKRQRRRCELWVYLYSTQGNTFCLLGCYIAAS